MRISRLLFYLSLLVILFNSRGVFADTEQQIQQLLQSAPSSHLTQRIHYFSTALLNQPYRIAPLGEGSQGAFNQGPLYRLDGFDCQTLVETVMALSLADNLTDFKNLMLKIRYANGQAIFNQRNHFPSADWLPNNTNNGFITDITATIAGKNNTAISRVYINRQQWYCHLTAASIQIPGLTAAQIAIKLAQLHSQSDHAINTWASIHYLPRTALIINGRPNETLLKKIPDGAIILFVNHPANEIQLIGTQLNVTHMGYAIWQNNTLYFREASSELNQVTDVNLIRYLQDHPWFKGISIWRIVTPAKPS
jgi:hypothetical protein